MERDLRALSGDISRLAFCGLGDEQPATSAESEDGVTSASGASEGEARRAGGTSGTDAGIPASSGDESYKQAGLKVRQAGGGAPRVSSRPLLPRSLRLCPPATPPSQAIDELGASLSSGLSSLLGTSSWPVRAPRSCPARRAPDAWCG